jgi:hypothetical protein
MMFKECVLTILSTYRRWELSVPTLNFFVSRLKEFKFSNFLSAILKFKNWRRFVVSSLPAPRKSFIADLFEIEDLWQHMHNV